MSFLSFVSRVTAPGAADRSQISDLLVLGDRLYASTRYDGVITSWDISGAAPVLTGSTAYDGGLAPGRIGSLLSVTLDAGDHLMSGGAADGGLQLHGLAGDGALTSQTPLAGTSAFLGGLHHAVSVTLGTGQQVIYGGLADRDGLGRVFLDGDGTPSKLARVSDTAATYAADVSDVVTLSTGGRDYIYTASATEHGITTWTVGVNGGLAAGPGLGVDEGLWIATPTALATAAVAGDQFVIVASAGSHSLSVLRVDTDGSMHVTDHMLDTRDTRFGGATAVEAITHQGQTYVVSGGADDGITVHALLPDGHLVLLAAMADTTAAGLANISDIALRGAGSSLYIHAASASEDGITTLVFDTGTAGITAEAASGGEAVTGTAGRDVLIGRAGDDTLTAGAGRDILRDGDGADTLTGGAGADIFVLAYDDTPDVITDFTVGEDKLDLSGWPMVRAITQLDMVATATGMTITYGDELLTVLSADGEPIDHRTLTEADVIQGHRIPQVILPGFPGPYTPPPDLPDGFTPNVSTGGNGTAPGPGGATTITIGGLSFRKPDFRTGPGERITGSDGRDVIRGGSGHDRLRGEGGADTITGGGKTDRIWGGAQGDRLGGGKGDDRLFGGAGADRLKGGKGDDLLKGGQGRDVLRGQGGDDKLVGGKGRDDLLGNGGRDRLLGHGDRDTLKGGGGADALYGGGARDTLKGGKGGDRLDGGAGRDRLWGDGGADRIIGGRKTDKLWGGAGNDSLNGGSGADVLAGGAGRDVLYGGSGRDTASGGSGADQLFGGGAGDALSGNRGDDRLWGGAGSDRLYGDGGADQAYGGSGYDKIWGGAGRDRLWGGADADSLWGGTGPDTLTGGGGHDRLSGQDDEDRLYGEGGHDRLYGGGARDRMSGNGGNDTLWGDGGDDLLWGDDGADTLWGGAGRDKIEGGTGADRLEGGSHNDSLTGGTGNDLIKGGTGHDQTFGGSGADRLFGEAGTDTLDGGSGADQLFGGSGADRLDGGDSGDDVLTGGTGADVFVFQTGRDQVMDFEQGLDQIIVDFDAFPGRLVGSELLLFYGAQSGRTVTLDFENGNVLIIRGVDDYATLANDLSVV